MKQLFLFILMLMPMSSWAQISEANQKVIDECGKSNGKMTHFTAGKCELQRCKYADNKSDGKFYRVGDNSRTNCNDAELKAELDKIATDLNINVNNGAATPGGSGGTSANAGNGGKPGDGNGGKPGDGNGGKPGDGNGGKPGDGNGGTTADAGNGRTAAGDGEDDGRGGIRCEWVLSGILSSGHPCAKFCKKQWLSGKQGIDRKRCRECVEKQAVENGGDLVVDWTKIPGGKPNKSSVAVRGVQVRTGEIICYDIRTGAVVSRTNGANTGGALCPAGSSTTPGGIIVGPNGQVRANGTVIAPGAGGTVVINAGGSANGTIELPEFCKGRNYDKKACKAWMSVNSGSGRFNCSSSNTTAACVGQDHMNDTQGRYDRDCQGGNCRPHRAKDNSWIGEGISGLAVGAGTALSAYFTGKSYERGQEAWANASVRTAEQCRINNDNYRRYTISQELTAITPDQHAAMSCNGSSMGNYAGMGTPGLGGWLGGGYSPGYLNGQIGPYGGYNPYGGGMVGGAIGGMPGGMVGGMPGGMVGGMPGGMVGGMAGGMVGGMPGGMVGGFPGGMVGGGIGGVPGGFAAAGMQGGFINGGGAISGMQGGLINGGGFQAGMQGGFAAAGMQGGFAAAGMHGGFAAAGMQGGGFQAGMQGGGFQAGMQGGGFQAGMQGGGFQAGMQGGGFQAGMQGGGFQAGMQGGYINGVSMAGGFNNGGGYVQGGYMAGGVAGGHNGPGGYNPGGWGSGTAQNGNHGNYWDASRSASNNDMYLQNAGQNFQSGMGYGANYGGMNNTASYNPMNAGGQFNAYFNMGR